MHTASPSYEQASALPSDHPVLLSDYDFDLPGELIAQEPAADRDSSRLLVVDRAAQTRIHSTVRALPELLRDGDLLVVNDTQVLPARMYAKTTTGASVELLFVRPINTPAEAPSWLCIGKPARRLRDGITVRFPSGVNASVARGATPGQYTVRFGEPTDVLALLRRDGEMPLPPYIKRPDGPLPLDTNRYQTVFASRPGAVAAPTAGLHFTPQLLDCLTARGIRTARLTLHVGPGTFLPIRDDDVSMHVMEPEWAEISEITAQAIRDTKAAGGRVVAVGTTTTRALESAASAAEVIRAGQGWADRFIVPGYRFQVIDALFTNFHLPGSTLLLLVAALTGRALLLETYAEAIAARYRFYSYGDAMLIQ